jgi:hypothetical protein
VQKWRISDHMPPNKATRNRHHAWRVAVGPSSPSFSSGLAPPVVSACDAPWHEPRGQGRRGGKQGTGAQGTRHWRCTTRERLMQPLVAWAPGRVVRV